MVYNSLVDGMLKYIVRPRPGTQISFLHNAKCMVNESLNSMIAYLEFLKGYQPDNIN